MLRPERVATPPSARGMGHRVQYSLGLKQSPNALGFETLAVHAFRMPGLDDPDWTVDHAWVRSGAAPLPAAIRAGRSARGRERRLAAARDVL